MRSAQTHIVVVSCTVMLWPFCPLAAPLHGRELHFTGEPVPYTESVTGVSHPRSLTACRLQTFRNHPWIFRDATNGLRLCTDLGRSHPYWQEVTPRVMIAPSKSFIIWTKYRSPCFRQIATVTELLMGPSSYVHSMRLLDILCPPGCMLSTCPKEQRK